MAAFAFLAAFLSELCGYKLCLLVAGSGAFLSRRVRQDHAKFAKKFRDRQIKDLQRFRGLESQIEALPWVALATNRAIDGSLRAGNLLLTCFVTGMRYNFWLGALGPFF